MESVLVFNPFAKDILILCLIMDGQITMEIRSCQSSRPHFGTTIHLKYWPCMALVINQSLTNVSDISFSVLVHVQNLPYFICYLYTFWDAPVQKSFSSSLTPDFLLEKDLGTA